MARALSLEPACYVAPTALVREGAQLLTFAGQAGAGNKLRAGRTSLAPPAPEVTMAAGSTHDH